MTIDRFVFNNKKETTMKITKKILSRIINEQLNQNNNLEIYIGRVVDLIWDKIDLYTKKNLIITKERINRDIRTSSNRYGFIKHNIYELYKSNTIPTIAAKNLLSQLLKIYLKVHNQTNKSEKE